MFVGGEFCYDGWGKINQPVIDTKRMTFLNGGKACLIVISDFLLSRGIERILLPSYLCPTIVDTFERCGLACDYYQIRRDFSIDLEDLQRKAEGHRAFYFINYFGFPHASLEQNLISFLKSKGMFVVEDNAHAIFSVKTLGDFVFYSLRKLAPYDGGYLITPHDIAPFIEKRSGIPNRRLPLISEYRARLAEYLYKGLGSREQLVNLYEQAERVYAEDMTVEGDAQEQEAIEHLDWNSMRARRHVNYAYLLGLIKDIRGIEPIFPLLPPDLAPLGLPVYVSGIDRDRLFDALGEAGIGLTVHWDGLVRDSRLNGNETAVEMARSILTLVTDQRWGHKHMDYQAQKLREILG